MHYILLVAGFLLLIKGADLFVDGSSSIAKRLKIPGIIVGLTIVAMGTSAPEAAVSISATFQGSNDIAVGNIIGSCILNLMLVAGICALIKPISVNKSIIKIDFPIAGIASLLLLLLCIGATLMISRIEGIILLILFITFLIITVKRALKYRKNADDSTDENTLSSGKAAIFTIIGAAAIVIGGQLTVESAKTIASSWGISENLIGLTIVALGTSLPELVTSIIAASKGESDLAIGNVIGSNIFNILFILGMTATLKPIKVDIVSVYDAIILVAFTIISYVFAVTRNKISRWEGGIMVAFYSAYTTYIIMR